LRSIRKAVLGECQNHSSSSKSRPRGRHDSLLMLEPEMKWSVKKNSGYTCHAGDGAHGIPGPDRA
jgi:hypothetical protein